MKYLGRLVWSFAAVLLAVAVLLATLRFGLWNPSYESVKAQYATAPSQFLQVGTASVHLRDEGQGAVLLMLHSSQTNLREWDAWADVLKTHYRVIRLDWSPYGLTVNESEQYSMEHAVELLEKLVDQLNLPKFTLVGSSSGATICVIYAARHPERVAALALSTLPLAAPPPSRTDPRVTAMGWAHRVFFPDYFPRPYYQWLLRGLFADPAKVTPELVEWYYKSNNTPGTQQRIASYLKADLQTIWKNTGHGDAEKVAGPVLLQWGDADPVLPAELGDSAKAHLSNAKVTLIHYANAGHYPMLEIPEITVRDLQAFLSSVHSATP